MADNYDLSTVGGRVEYIIRECRYPTPAAFSRAVGTSPQNVNKWVNTNSIGTFGPKLRAVTAVNLNWLLTGDGEPFPEGPMLYAHEDGGTDKRAADKAIHQLENDVDSMRYLLNALVAVMIASRPDEADHVARTIRDKVPKKFVENGYLKLTLDAFDKASKKAKTRHS